jgi:hypothetical protein
MITHTLPKGANGSIVMKVRCVTHQALSENFTMRSALRKKKVEY